MTQNPAQPNLLQTLQTNPALLNTLPQEVQIKAAELLEAPDVVATNAIHAAIAAADAIACYSLGERSGDGNHAAAVELHG